jgi:hypothetical protein
MGKGRRSRGTDTPKQKSWRSKELLVSVVGSVIGGGIMIGLSKALELLPALITLLLAIFGPSTITPSPSAQNADVTVQLNITSPAVVALVAAFFGIVGTTLGKILQNIIMIREEGSRRSVISEYFGHSLHFSVFAAFFIIGIVWTLDQCSLNSNIVTGFWAKLNELGRVVALSLLCALPIGGLYPLMNLRCYGTLEGALKAGDRPVSWSRSLIWYTLFGVLLGLASGFVFQQSVSVHGSVHDQGWLISALVPGVYCGLFGSWISITIHRSGGIGIANLYRLEDGLIGAMMGTLIGLVLSFVMTFWHSQCPTGDDMWLGLMIWTNIGALVGSICPRSVQLYIRRVLLGHVESHIDAITPVLKVILIIVVVLPWGAIVAYALNTIGKN